MGRITSLNATTAAATIPTISGTSVPVAQVYDVVRRLGVARAIERFDLHETDVLSAMAYQQGVADGSRRILDAMPRKKQSPRE